MTWKDITKNLNNKKVETEKKKFDEYTKKETIKKIKDEIRYYEDQLAWTKELERDWKAGKLEKEYGNDTSFVAGFLKNYRRILKNELEIWKGKLEKETL